MTMRVDRGTRLALLVLFALAPGCSKKSVTHPVIPPSPFAAWTRLPGPSTADVRAVVSPGGSTVVAGGRSGTWRSADAGATWTLVDGALVNAMTAHGGVIWAATTTGVLRSLDDGVSWEDFNTGLAANTNVLSITWSPLGILAGLASGGGVVAFANGDDHWTSASSGLPGGTTVNALAYEPGLQLTAGSAAGHTYVFTSGDWVEQALNAGTPVLAVEPIEGGHVFAGTLDQGIFVDATSAGLPAGTSVYGFTRFGAADYAGTNHHLYRTTNAGANWNHVLAPIADGMPVTSLASAGGALFAGTAGRGVLKSPDGTNWSSSGPPDARVYALFQLAGGTVFAGTARGIQYSNDEGQHWIGASLDSGLVDCFAAKGTTLYAGTLGQGVARSTDGGATWEYASTGLPAGAGVYRLASDGTVLIADLIGDPIGLYRSLDGGDTWTPVSTIPTPQNVADLAVLGGRIFAGEFGANGGVFVTVDHGDTWAPVNGGRLGGKTITALGAGGIAVYAAATDGIWFTEDNGISWHATLAPTLIAKQIAVHGEDVAVVANDGTVLRTKDAGVHWDLQTPASLVLSAAAGNTGFFLGTEAAAWRASY